ncbi:DNA-directed DNA polymerase [Tanacetum coccineum]
MDSNSCLGKMCLEDNVIEISSEKIEGLGDWNSPEYQDTAGSKGKKVMNVLSFYRIETDEISERYIAPCFVNGLEAYDGEVNLAVDENLISNEFAVKLCLDYEVKKGKKLVKKELIVALKGELYFVKFIINLKEDDFEPVVILGRSFLRLAKGVVDFGNGVITIYPEPDPFEDDFEKTGKSLDDWDQLLDFNFNDVPKFGEELPPFVCKMGKSNRDKRGIGNQDQPKICFIRRRETCNRDHGLYDKYKKILDKIWKDKVELDGKTVKEDEEAVKRIKGKALKEKYDPRALIFPIRLEGKVNENALANTRSDINTMPYRIFETLGREDMKKIDRGITMINHTQAEAMGKLSNVLCQVGVTTIIVKFLILDIPIDRDAPMVVARGFLYTMGNVLNSPERLFSIFDGVCHQTFRAARLDVLRTAETDSDDEEEYVIKRTRFGAPIYGPKPAPYLNCTNPKDRSSSIQTLTNPFRKISVWKKAVSFLGSLPMPLKQVNWKPDHKGCYTNEEEATGQWHVAWVITRWMKRKGVETQKESQICCGQFISKLAIKLPRVLTEDVCSTARSQQPPAMLSPIMTIHHSTHPPPLPPPVRRVSSRMMTIGSDDDAAAVSKGEVRDLHLLRDGSTDGDGDGFTRGFSRRQTDNFYELLAKAISRKFSTPTNNHLCSSSNTRNQAVVHGRVDIQTKNAGYSGNDNKNVGRQNRNQAFNAGNGNDESNQIFRRVPRNESTPRKANVQCYNCNEKGHYARDY